MISQSIIHTKSISAVGYVMSLDLKNRVVEFLSSNAEKQFKARDIALWIAESYQEQVAEKLERSSALNTHAEVLTQLVSEIGANRPLWQKQFKELRTTEGVRPRLYYWTALTEAEEVQMAENDVELSLGKLPLGSQATLTENQEAPQNKLKESDLYPTLVEFLKAEYGVEGYRIDERRSSNNYSAGGNKWLYPDVVGMENLTDGLHPEVVSAIRESRDRRVRLWSFEAKLLINRSNARETYFQAVSNSSWANFGYLVAANFEGVDTLKELRILYAVHGIGLIQLNPENPTESQIIVPARERQDIEWPMCSRLATENRDFKSFMKKVRQFFQTGDM